jgi:hypothetical protein
MKGMRNVYKILVGTPEGKTPGAEGMIILKRILGKLD